MGIHLAINSVFAVVETEDLNYELRYYVISKRIGRLATGNLLVILLLVAKNDFIASVSGLTLDKSVFFHKWLGRFMFLATTVHMCLSLKYWLDMKFYIMVKIPPQIFGMMSYACLGMLNLASLKIFRNFAFDLFLVQHRVFNFIMLLMAFFHNGGNKALVILSVHLLVLDRITSRVLGILHKRKGPTKGISEFEVMDDSTIRITIPITILNADPNKWWWCFVPRYGTWRAGQHIHLNVSKVSLFQYHPFTVASLPDSGKMVILMKVHKGFTKKLLNKLAQLKEAENEEAMHEPASGAKAFGKKVGHKIGASVKNTLTQIKRKKYTEEDLSSVSTTSVADLNAKSIQDPFEISEEVEISSKAVQDFKDLCDLFRAPDILQMKAGINGPYGGHYMPLTKFDNVVFFSAGSGASFTLPVALDLLKTIRARELVDDYLYRPQNSRITIVMAIKKRENLQWYDHLWEEFLPFLDQGRAHLMVHVTQEIADAGDADIQIDVDEKNNFSDSNKTDSIAATFSTTSSFEKTGVTITYGRPDFATIINQAAKFVSCQEFRKSLACLGCGPNAFNGEIKTQCEKNKWIDGAPDVYCYTESFG